MTKQEATDQLKHRVSELMKENNKIQERRDQLGLTTDEVFRTAQNNVDVKFYKELITILEQ
jgi:hypothetical protein